MPCRVSGSFHAKPLRMARSAISRPHRRGFGVRRIACLPPPYENVDLPSKDTETVMPLYTLPRLPHFVTVLRALGWQIE
jgi:hypothetical protein